MDNNQKYVHSRLNDLSRDLTESLKLKMADEKWNQETENEINELIDDAKQAFPKNVKIQNFPEVSIRGGKLDFIDAQTHHLLGQVRKLTSILDSKLELDKAKQLPQNVFNIHQNQEVIQNNSQIFENIISNINQFDMDINIKKEILDLVNSFKNESIKDTPNINKLKEIFQKIKDKSKEAAAMVSYWATMTGALDKIFDQINNLPK